MSIKGWKTLAFAVALGAITALSEPGLQQWVAENLTWAGPVLGVMIAGLRALTSSAIFKRE